MDDLRIKRYRDKINYIIDKIKDLQVNPKNDLEKNGIFYIIQTSIEAMTDIIAMLIKDMGIPVEEDSTNISEIVKKRKINLELGEKLKKANGLRNILVHRYNNVDEQIILDSVEDIRELLFNWLDIVEEILNELSQ
jgi:uncharacterized protein YutE (UPF0331/DUF86 family)